MKKITVFAITIILSFIGNTHSSFSSIWELNDSYIKLIVIDNLGNRDSATAFYRSDATFGIDTAYSEVDLINEPSNQLDVRVIQRKYSPSLNPISPLDSLVWIQFNTWEFNRIYYFENDLDVKQNYLPFVYEDNRFLSFPAFSIKASNFPIVVNMEIDFQISLLSTAHYVNAYPGGDNTVDVEFRHSVIPIHNDERNTFDSVAVYHSQEEIGTIGIVMIGYASAEDPTKGSESSYKLFPNPTNDKITISTSFGSCISIYDTNGKVVETIISESEVVEIDVSNYTAGVYYIKDKDKTYKFVKN